jgi:hypothetical protein
MDPVFLFVALTAAGIINPPPSLRGVWKKPAYTAWGTDVLSQDLARPRVSRYRFSLSVRMIVVGVAGLIKVVGK